MCALPHQCAAAIENDFTIVSSTFRWLIFLPYDLFLFIKLLLSFVAAAYGLLQKKSRLFSLSGNNAFLEFFLEGTPEIVQTHLDSKKVIAYIHTQSYF